MHTLPAVVKVGDRCARMRPHIHQDAAYQPSNLSWVQTSEGVATDQHAPQAMDTAEDLVAESQKMRSDEQVTTDSILLPPIDQHLQALYDAFHTSYALPISETSAHMQKAGDLALALLQRHHPSSHGYVVEPATLGPYSTKGVSFVLKEVDESDSDPDAPPSKKQKRKARKTNAHYSYSASWHHVAPENMAAFVVKKLVSDADEDVESMTYRTHTCLVIVLDDLSTFQRWSRSNLNHRGDVLSDMLGVLGEIESGHGMLLFGPRLELYNYDASNEDKPVEPAQVEDWRMDTRTNCLAAVDKVLRDFTRQEVVHKDTTWSK